MSKRTAIFARPAPAGWKPAVGEGVYLPTTPGRGGNKASTAKVVAVVHPLFVLVRFRYAGRWHRASFTADELRPLRAGG